MLKRIGRNYCCREKFCVNESVPLQLLRMWRHSFSSIIDGDGDGDIDSPRFHQSSSQGRDSWRNNESSPPGPGRVSNRPLRGDRRRPTVYSSGYQHSGKSAVQFGVREDQYQGREREIEDSDFLEKFKLRFDRNKSENPVTKESPERRDEVAAAASELPPQDADEIFKKMKETGLIPNAVAMLDGLCKDGLVQEAMKLFGVMREKGTLPEVVIYTAVVEGFCQAQKLEDAIRIFRKMQGNGVTPNAFSYRILIQGLCRGKRLDSAAEFCNEMLEAGHSPNVATFISLVDSFTKEKGMEETQSLITSLRQKGLVFDEKSVREYLEKKGPFSSLVWEVLLGKKAPLRSSLF